MTDHMLWKNDITNRFSPTSLTDTTVGSIITATSVISGVTTKSGDHMSKWDAYLDLRLKLLDGVNYLPQSTTTQRNALTGIIDGTLMLNITTNREEVCSSASWISAAGDGLMAKASFGSMFENNSSGSSMQTTNKTWITAGVGKLDANGLITFVSDDTNGDYLLVGTGGAGDYMIVASCGHTNAGNNITTMSIHVNGTDNLSLHDDQNGNATSHRPLIVNGIITLAESDKITLHNVSSTPADIVKVYDCHVTINRLS